MAGNETNILQSGMREFAEFADARAVGEARVQPVSVKDDLTGGVVALVARGRDLVDLSKFVPAVPKRKTGTLDLVNAESFIELVNEQKTESSRVFGNVDADPATFTCIFDFHGPALAGWREFKAVLTLRRSQELKIWMSQNGKMLSQAEFAEFLKDNRGDIVEPAGSAVLELVMALELSIDRRAKGKVQTNDGTQVAFEEDQRASVGGNRVTVPDTLRLAVPFFTGADLTPISADFKVRIGNDGKMQFGFRLLAVERQVREATLQVSAKIREKTGLPVFI